MTLLSTVSCVALLSAAIRCVVAQAGSIPAGTGVVVKNDDGWATAMIRQQFSDLLHAGYRVSLVLDFIEFR